MSLFNYMCDLDFVGKGRKCCCGWRWWMLWAVCTPWRKRCRRMIRLFVCLGQSQQVLDLLRFSYGEIFDKEEVGSQGGRYHRLVGAKENRRSSPTSLLYIPSGDGSVFKRKRPRIKSVKRKSPFENGIYRAILHQIPVSSPRKRVQSHLHSTPLLLFVPTEKKKKA